MNFVSRHQQYHFIESALSVKRFIATLSGHFYPCGPYSILLFEFPHLASSEDEITIATMQFAFIFSLNRETYDTIIEGPVCCPLSVTKREIASKLLTLLPSSTYYGEYSAFILQLPDFIDSEDKLESFISITDTEIYLQEIKQKLIDFEFPTALPDKCYDLVYTNNNSEPVAVISTREDLEIFCTSDLRVRRLTYNLYEPDFSVLVTLTDRGFVINEGPFKGTLIHFNSKLLPKYIYTIKKDKTITKKIFAGKAKRDIFAIQLTRKPSPTDSYLDYTGSLYEVSRAFSNSL